MTELPTRDRYVLDLRNLMWNATASVAAAAIVVSVGGALRDGVVVGAILLVVLAWYLNRDRRQRQATLASVLKEPSSSKSAQRALQMILDDLNAGRGGPEAVLTAELVKGYRVLPISTLLTVPLRMLGNGRTSDIREVARALGVVIKEMDLAQEKIKHELAKYLSAVSPSATLVLYGYSRTVLGALEVLANARALPNPIWIVEDLQYGSASVGEHAFAAKRLRQMNVSASLLPFDVFARAIGHQRVDDVTTVDGQRVIVTRAPGFIGVIGCDASDDSGTCLIPGITDGEASGTQKFVELFAGVRLDEPRRLIVASESYKMIESCGADPIYSYAPLSTPLWVRALHAAGFAVPIRGRRVKLLEIRNEVSAIVSDRGTITTPFGSSELRSIRERWDARLTSDLQSAVMQLKPAMHNNGHQIDFTASTSERLYLVADVAELVKVCGDLPPLPIPTQIVPELQDEALATALTPLLMQGFPERQWTPALVNDQVLTPHTIRAVFVFQQAGRYLGVVTLHDTEDSGVGRLHWLTVALDQRSKRYGLALIKSVVREADKLRFCKLELITERSKQEAAGLYTRLGFMESSRWDENSPKQPGA